MGLETCSLTMGTSMKRSREGGKEQRSRNIIERRLHTLKEESRCFVLLLFYKVGGRDGRNVI